MKITSHDEIFSISVESKCDTCGELEGFTAVIETITKASSLCLDCAFKAERITEPQYKAGKNIEKTRRLDWEEGEKVRKKGEAEFLARMKSSNPCQEDEE